MQYNDKEEEPTSVLLDMLSNFCWTTNKQLSNLQKKFPNASFNSCFFHLMQNVGYATDYKNYEKLDQAHMYASCSSNDAFIFFLAAPIYQGSPQRMFFKHPHRTFGSVLCRMPFLTQPTDSRETLARPFNVLGCTLKGSQLRH